MACPVASIVALGSLFPPARTLFTHDRRGRWFAWSGLLLLAAGWIAYFETGRLAQIRIAMEVISIALLVIAGLRIRVLARRDGNGAAWARALRESGRMGWRVLRSPWVLGAKAVLLTLLALEWGGWVHIPVRVFALSVIALLTFAGIRIWRLRRPARFETLESFANRPVEGNCPLGFDSAPRSGIARS